MIAVPPVVAIFYSVSALLMFAMAVLLLLRRAKGELSLVAAMLTAAYWAACNGAGWDFGSYAGAMLTIPFLTVFGARQANSPWTDHPAFFAAVWLVPLFCVATVYLPALRFLFDTPWAGLAQPTYALFLAHAYLCLAWLAWTLWRNRSYLLLLGLLPPILLDVPNELWPGIYGFDDPAPLGFSLTGLLFFLLVYRYRLTGVSPIARSHLFDKFPDPLVVLNLNRRVIDRNEAAERLGLAHPPPRRKYATLLDAAQKQGSARREGWHRLSTGEERYFDVEAARLEDAAAKPWGYLVQFHDIHDRKLAELRETEQRQMAEALQQIALTITTNPHATEVLEVVAEQLHAFFRSTASIILEARENGKLVLWASRGKLDPRLHQWLEDGTLNWVDTPGYLGMVESGDALLVPDTAAWPQWRDLDGRIRSFVGAPVKILGATIGFLHLDQEIPGHFTPLHAQRLKAFADLTAIVIHNARLFRQNEELANTDPLTGLMNRRAFFARAEQEFSRAKRYESPLSMLMLDLDRFKAINDEKGHLEGDRVLVGTAEAIRSCLRELDLAGRFGGDEFCILLPETDETGARQTALRLVAALRERSIDLSVGAASLKPAHRQVDDLLLEADQALYRAKAQGRAASAAPPVS